MQGTKLRKIPIKTPIDIKLRHLHEIDQKKINTNIILERQHLGHIVQINNENI